jgi:hypothetical protein
MHANGNSLVAYGNKMVNDMFDGTVGFAIDGGIKDSKFVSQTLQGTSVFFDIIFSFQSHPSLDCGAELPDACKYVNDLTLVHKRYSLFCS